MNLQEYINAYYDGKPTWFLEEVGKTSHYNRVMNVLDIKEYLDGKHSILNQQTEFYKGETFEPRKIVLQLGKNLLNFETSYLLQNKVTLIGNDKVLDPIKSYWKKGKYDKLNKKILDKVVKYGDVWEFVYLDGNKIKSHLINAENGFEVVSPSNEYLAFVEHYTIDGVSYYTIYEKETVTEYNNSGGELKLTGSYNNLSKTLPIRYRKESETNERVGRSSLQDYIPILDEMERLISKFSESFYKHHNPFFYVQGQKLTNESIDPSLVGAVLQLDDGASLNSVQTKLDYQSFKTLWETLTQQLLTIANVPAVTFSKVEISNISETSLKLLYSIADIRGSFNEEIMREGILRRFNAMKELLSYLNIQIDDELLSEMDILFSYARPLNESEIVEQITKLKEYGVLSKQSAVENNPYVNNVSQEMERLNNEGDNEMRNKVKE